MGGAGTSKFRPIPQFGDFHSTSAPRFAISYVYQKKEACNSIYHYSALANVTNVYTCRSLKPTSPRDFSSRSGVSSCP